MEISNLAMDKAGEPPEEEVAGALQGGSEIILVVDDEEYILDFGEKISTRFGYTVLTAADGESALELYRKEQGRIDLIVLDLIMPGMGGRRCLEGLIKLNPQAKIIVSSGYAAKWTSNH